MHKLLTQGNIMKKLALPLLISLTLFSSISFASEEMETLTAQIDGKKYTATVKWDEGSSSTTTRLELFIDDAATHLSSFTFQNNQYNSEEEIFLAHLNSTSIAPTAFPLPVVYKGLMKEANPSKQEYKTVKHTLISALSKGTVSYLRDILEYHASRGVPIFSNLGETKDAILKTAASLVIQGKATADTDALKQALIRAQVPTLQYILEYHISNQSPFVANINNAKQKKNILREAASLVVNGQATRDTDALLKAIGKIVHVSTLETVLNYHISNGVPVFKTLSLDEKSDLLLNAGSLVVQGKATADTEALNKAIGQKHVPELRRILNYHISNSVSQFASLSLEKRETLLLNAGFLVVTGKATLDTDALTKALVL